MDRRSATTSVWITALDRGADRIARWTEQGARAVPLIFSLVYFPSAFALARAKPFWFDELYTYYIARLPSLADIASTLLPVGGQLPVDRQPLLFFAATRTVGHLVNDPHIGMRLPEIIGFWLACTCLYWIVRRRTNALYGAAAMLSPFLTMAFSYATEARPYALMLGCAALALLAWQRIDDGPQRGLARGVLALALVGTFWSSYMGVLVVAVITAAEIVRSMDKRVVDWWTCAAFIPAGVAGLVSVPFVVGGVSGVPSHSSLYAVAITLYSALLGGNSVSVAVAIVTVAVAGYVVLTQPTSPWQQQETRWEWPPRHEMVAAMGLLLLPVLGHITTALYINTLLPRYVLPTVIGFGVLLTTVMFNAARGSSAVGVLLALISLASGAYAARSQLADGMERHRSVRVLRELLAQAPTNLPVVVDDTHLFLEMAHYERPDVVSRLRSLTSEPLTENTLSMPGQAVAEAKFLRTQPEFLMLTSDMESSDLISGLQAEGATIRLLALARGQFLFLVQTRPPAV